MDFENIEYWVLKSMEEAREALVNGEVPVGCLFLIQRAALDSLTKENLQSHGGKRLAVREIQPKLEQIPPGVEMNANISEVAVREIQPEFQQILSEVGVNENISEVNKNEALGPFRIQISPSGEDKSGGYIVVARGKNEVNATKNATRHAEMVCIDQIVELYSVNYASVFEKLTVIVNVEPCIMCMAALLDLNVRTVVFTCVNDRFGYNILAKDTRTNYVEIVEERELGAEEKHVVSEDEYVRNDEHLVSEDKHVVSEDERLVSEDEHLVSEDEHLVSEESVREQPESYRKVDFKDDADDMKERMDMKQEPTITEDVAQGFEVFAGKDGDMKNESLEIIKRTLSKADVEHTKEIGPGVSILDRPYESVRYNLSYDDKKLIANKNDQILSKASCLLKEDTWNLCHVFHYRKYELETMGILKLFYKGVNPNAPKSKVKIKS